MAYGNAETTESVLSAFSLLKWNTALTTIIRWFISKFSLHNQASAALMLFAVFAFYSIFLIHGTGIFYEQDKRELLLASFVETSARTAEKPISNGNQTAAGELKETSASAIMQEKRMLRACQKEKKAMSNRLKAEQDAHRKTKTADLFDKLKHRTDPTIVSVEYLVEEQKKIRQYVTAFMTTYREFFDYMAAALRDTPYPGVGNYTRYQLARLGMLPLSGVEALIPEFGPVVNDVTSFRYSVSIPPCPNVITAAAISISTRTVFIAVISAPGNFNKRDMIRQTWLSHLEEAHREGVVGVAGFAFILGQTEDNLTQNKIEEESKSYGDLIQIVMSDFYRNLSLKVAGLLNWMNTNCAKVEFVLKVDDDVFVNVRNLAHFLRSHQSSQTMFGLGAGNLFPARDGQWNITFEDWPWNQYPPYFFGPAILMPGSTILPLLAACQTTPMMPFDDVYLTGMCTEKAGIQLRFSTNSTRILGMGLPSVPLACDVRRLIAWTTVSGAHMTNSHVATNDFYRNVTRCDIADSGGFNRTVDDPTEFIQFDFN